MKAGRLVLFTLFALFLLCCSTSFAGSIKSNVYTETRYAIGYRTDRLDWNIAGSSGVPNILSELTWRDQSALEFKVSRIYINKTLYVRSSLDYAFIIDGTNQDSDYTGNNRTGEYSRSDNKADDGALWDASIGIGKVFKGKASSFALLGGFSVHRQELQLTDGFQTICVATCTVSTGPFAGLDSRYNATWYGPWVGVDVSHSAKSGKLSTFANVELHLARYYAEANWNLRNDFKHPKSFEHEANGVGVVVNAGLDYALSAGVSIGGELGYQAWNTADGTDRTFFSDGAVSTTRLNEVNWTSASFLALLKYKF